MSKVIRLNPIQIRYLQRLLQEDLEFNKKLINEEKDLWAKDYLNFNLEVCKDIISKLQE